MSYVQRVSHLLTDSSPTPAGRIIEAALLVGDARLGRDQPRHYPHKALVLLVRGGGFYRDTRGVERRVGAGDLIFIEPTVGHAYGPPPGGTWEELYVSYEGPVFDALTAAGAPSPARPVLSLGDPGAWRERLEAAFPPQGRPVSLVEAARQLGALLEFILAAHAAAARVSADETNEEESWLALARQLLGAPGRDAPSLAAVARRCGLKAESFRKRFTHRTGEPPGRFRLVARVEQAKRLLRNRHLPMRVVAEATGFCDEYHFSRTFKRLSGRTPREWRMQAGVESGA